MPEAEHPAAHMAAQIAAKAYLASKAPAPRTKLYIFDADDTLRRCTVPGQPCPNKQDEWELLPGVSETLQRLLFEEKAALAVASNQGGVGLGFMTQGMAVELLSSMMLEATTQSAPLWSIHICPHRPDAGCACRKPAPGLLIEACAKHHVAPTQAIFVGDRESDRLAADAAGIPFRWAHEFFGWSVPTGAGINATVPAPPPV